MKSVFLGVFNAITATLLCILILEISSSWLYFVDIETVSYYEYYFLIQSFIQFFIISYFIYIVKNKKLRILFKKVEFNWYLLGALLGVIFVFIQIPLNTIYNIFTDVSYQIFYSFDSFEKLLNISSICAILIVPFYEELFFRSYIQSKLQKKLNSYIAILLSALLFGLIHAPYMNLFLEFSHQDWHLAYITFFGGAISGILYYNSKSVIPSIVFHVFWNMTAIVV